MKKFSLTKVARLSLSSSLALTVVTPAPDRALPVGREAFSHQEDASGKVALR
jgi:hypothetical protein